MEKKPTGKLNYLDSSNVGASVWEEWWWSKFNPMCLYCQKECKQSSMAEIFDCPQYIKE